MEGLYSGLSSGAALSSTQLDVKMKLLVEAPAAVEDALASLLDHHDATLQVGSSNDAGLQALPRHYSSVQSPTCTTAPAGCAAVAFCFHKDIAHSLRAGCLGVGSSCADALFCACRAGRC